MALTKVLFMMDGYGVGPNTFTRSGSVGKYTDIDGILKDAAANVYRREWLYQNTYALGNLPDTPSLLVEAARTNLISSDNFDSGWTSVLTPVVAGSISDPAGGTGAYSIEDDNGAGAEGKYLLVAFTGDAVKSLVFVVRENTMASSGDQHLQLYDVTGATARLGLDISAWTNGEPTVAASVGTYLGKRSLGGGWWALYAQSTSVTAASTHRVYIYPAETASATGIIDVFRVNAYDATVPLYSIVDASEVKAVDTWYADFLPVPQAMTFYAKMLWLNEGLQYPRVATIADGSDNGPRLTIYSDGSQILVYHQNALGGSSVQASVSTATVSWGDTLEVLAYLNADGSTQANISVNGAAQVTGSASSALTLPVAWAAQRYYVGRPTTENGIGVHISHRVAAGVKTMAEMRALNPAMVLGGYAIPLEVGTVTDNRLEIGDRARTWDGTLRETIRSRVGQWDASTVPLSAADAAVIQGILESSTQPHTAFGSVFKSDGYTLPNVHSRLNERTLVQAGNEHRWALGFTAEESS